MNRGIHRARVAALLFAYVGAGCAVFSKKSGPAEAGDLVAAVERVYVEAEAGKSQSAGALSFVDAMVSAEFPDDAVKAHAELVRRIGASKEQSDRLRESVEPMKEAAGPYFEKWTKDLEGFQNPALRDLSRKRLEETRARYDAIVAAVDPAQEALDAMNRELEEHALFLSHDLNPAALAAIRPGVDAMKESGRRLASRLDECLIAARAYSDASAPPVRGAAPAAAPQESAGRAKRPVRGLAESR